MENNVPRMKDVPTFLKKGYTYFLKKKRKFRLILFSNVVNFAITSAFVIRFVIF